MKRHLPFRAMVSSLPRGRLGGSDHADQRLDADGGLSHLGIAITGSQAERAWQFQETSDRSLSNHHLDKSTGCGDHITLNEERKGRGMSAAARQSETARSEELPALLAGLCLAATRFVAPAKVEKTMRQWLGGERLYESDNPDRVLGEAMALALDFTLFAPSASGKTAIDRFARQHRPAHAGEEEALSALRRAQFRILEIVEPHPGGGIRARDLSNDELCHVVDEGPWTTLEGMMIGARLVEIEALGMVPVGPVTPLDEAALAVVQKRLSNPHRCAESLYRHVVRFGGPEVVGLNRPPDCETHDFPFTASDGQLHALAFAWSAGGGEGDPPADEAQLVRDAVSEQALMEILLAATLAEEQSMSSLASAYGHLLTLQLETVALRGAAGVAGPLSSLAYIEDLMEQAVADGALPAGARSVFATTCQHLQAAGHHTGKADVDLDKVLARIQALRLKTVDRGCTEEEAVAAAAKVASLLDQYGLSLGEVRLKDQNAEGFGVDTGRRRFGPIDNCLPVVGRFCDCRVWTEQGDDGQIRYIFFGLPADTEGARYLYELIEQAFETETRQFKQGMLYASHRTGERRSATHSFQTGLAYGIGQKLDRLREERQTTMQAAAGRNLVVVKDEVIDQDLAKLGLHFETRGVKRRRSVLKDAYEAGQEAGDRFTYSPGLTEDEAPAFGGSLPQ